MITPSFGLTATERVLPKLALDFTTANLDSRITFTRTTDATHPATYVDGSGYVTSATNNQPRFDYTLATGGACKGLLIEESRTNLVPYSEDFTKSTWTKGVNITLTGGQANDPANGSNATRLQMPTGSGTYIYRLDTLIAASYTVTVFARLRSGSTTGVFRLGASTTIVALTDANSVACTTTSTWQRFTYTFTATAASWYVGIDSIDSVTALDIEIFGFQLEAGAFATSYIPTTTSALTRNADVAVMTGTNFSDWFNASEGTFVFNASTVNFTNSDILLDATDGTTSNRIQMYVAGVTGAATTFMATGGATQAQFSAGTVTANTTFTFASGYKVNAIAASLNAATPATDTSATMPSGINTATLGCRFNGVNQLNGYLKKVSYYPQRLANAEIQAFSK